jgi:AAA+ ATPase superfamily predicted ATPase
MQNPYNFTRPVQQYAFLGGRDRELNEIKYYINLNRTGSNFHLALQGNRASGKTSLLNVVQNLFRDEKDILMVRVDLNVDLVTSEYLFYREIFSNIIGEGLNKGIYVWPSKLELPGRAKKFLHDHNEPLFFYEIRRDGTVDEKLLFPDSCVNAAKENRLDLHIPQRIAVEGFRTLFNGFSQRGIKVIVILLDECDLLSKNTALIQKQRNIIDSLFGYMYILSGTERMFPEMDKVFSPFRRQFITIKIDKLPHLTQVTECVRKPLEANEKGLFDDETIGRIFTLSNGMPYKINMLCHFLYEYKSLKGQNQCQITPEILRKFEEQLCRSQ